MTEHRRKTAPFNQRGIEALPNDKPVVYKVLGTAGDNIYTGVAKRGRVRARLAEHLPGGPDAIPGGTKVQVQQHSSIADAERSEARIVARSKPKCNKRGK